MARAIGTVATFALLGLGWGVIARVWMRFISTSPEFSWTGTIYIVAAPTIIGVFAGLAYVARTRQWRGSWLPRAAGGASVILLGVGAGMMMVPTLVLGTLAAARTDWPRWTRALLGLLALVPVIGVLAEPWILLDSLRAPLAAIWYLVLVGAMILILRVSLAPQIRPAATPSPRAARVPVAG